MKTKYTKKQIQESIKHWQRVLEDIDLNENASSPTATELKVINQLKAMYEEKYGKQNVVVDTASGIREKKRILEKMPIDDKWHIVWTGNSNASSDIFVSGKSENNVYASNIEVKAQEYSTLFSPSFKLVDGKLKYFNSYMSRNSNEDMSYAYQLVQKAFQDIIDKAYGENRDLRAFYKFCTSHPNLDANFTSEFKKQANANIYHQNYDKMQEKKSRIMIAEIPIDPNAFTSLVEQYFAVYRDTNYLIVNGDIYRTFNSDSPVGTTNRSFQNIFPSCTATFNDIFKAGMLKLFLRYDEKNPRIVGEVYIARPKKKILNLFSDNVKIA